MVLETEQRTFPVLGRRRGKRLLDLLPSCKRMPTIYKIEATFEFDRGWRLGDGISSLDQWKEERYCK